MTISADLTFTVEAGACVLHDIDYASRDDAFEKTVRLVLAFADHGYVKVRPGLTLSTLVGPRSGFFGLDDHIDQPFAQIVETLDSWARDTSA